MDVYNQYPDPAGRIATAPTARRFQLSRLGRKVKKMLGGIHGWHDNELDGVV